MKFKVLFSIAVAAATTFSIVSCDDNMDSIGQGIQPEKDKISMYAGEVFLTAETVKLDDPVYLRTKGALLGVLDDPILGRTKSDFLAEYFCANAEFEVGYDKKAVVDSVFFYMQYANAAVIGDTLSPMGITIYELNKKNLEPNFLTNVNPSDYTDMKTILGQRYFSHPDLGVVYNDKKQHVGKHLYIEMEKEYGQKLYDAWENDPSILKNTQNLREILKGIYVTSDFNNKALIEAANANLQIEVLVCYSYKRKKVNDITADSTVSRILPLQIAEDALQLNSITDTPSNAEVAKDENGNAVKTYVKSPAGMITKLTIPLKEIREMAEAKTGTDKYTINSSVFKLIGMTEEEKGLTIKNRPNTMLFINKDDIEKFFTESKTIDGITSLIMHRQATYDDKGYFVSSTNTYHFGLQNSTSLTNNISTLINHYVEKEKNETEKTDKLEYYVIPVNITTEATNTGTFVTGVTNTISPQAAIFRTDKDNMKMSLMFSKYSEIDKR